MAVAFAHPNKFAKQPTIEATAMHRDVITLAKLFAGKSRREARK